MIDPPSTTVLPALAGWAGMSAKQAAADKMRKSEEDRRIACPLFNFD
jgi:hypothetical protein